MNKKEARPSRLINGIRYRAQGTSRIKEYAYETAKEIRKLSYLARVVIEEDKYGKLYVIYTKKR